MGLLRCMEYSAEDIVQVSRLHTDRYWCFDANVLAHLEMILLLLLEKINKVTYMLQSILDK